MIRVLTFCLSLISLTLFLSCDKDEDLPIFSVQNDIDLGAAIAEEIANDESIELLSAELFPVSYAYIESMRDNILESAEITYREEFEPWTINIINDDQVLHAFSTPGGHIYVYTGLIYFLDKEDDLAGAIAHEIAHTDRRNGVIEMQRQYGIATLQNIAAGGNTSELRQLVDQLATANSVLAYSREAEAEANDYAVRYLAESPYACNGAADFFAKLLANEETFDPEYLRAHPTDESRAEDIEALATGLGCDTSIDSNSALRYLNFRNSLP